MKSLLIALGTVYGTLCAIGNAADPPALSLADLIEQAEPSCVRIDVKYKDGTTGIGSGFVVDAKRKWIATNYHVVGDSKTATVVFADGTKAEVEGWRAHYTQFDLALLQIKTDKQLIALPIAQTLPRKGESTIAIGTPQGLSFTATEGIISGIREGKELLPFGPKVQGTWLQTSTPISPGSSGGPLMNRSGEVVGVNSATLDGAQNLNFAISRNELARLVDVGTRIRLRELALLTPVSEAGSVPRKSSVSSKTLVIKIPSERRFRHSYKIEEDEDEFDQLTWLRTEWLPIKHENRELTSLGVRVMLAHDEQETALVAIWEVGTTSKGFQFLSNQSRRFQLAGGGDSVELPLPKREGKIDGFVISEVMTSITTLDTFVKLALTDNLKARLGETEMEFSKSQLECLRELASKIPLGEMADGKIRIERLKPEEDPTSSKYQPR